MSLSSPSTADDSSPASRLVTLAPWDFDAGIPTLGFEAAKWCERWLIQPNGPRAGQPFRLINSQLTFLLWWYALDPAGRWLFKHGARRLAKSSGKSPFAAVLALIEFLAPVRLERFDDRADGGCVGRTVDMPLVQIAATAESQTGNTMRMVRAFAPKGSRVAEHYGLDVGKTRYYKLPEGTLEVITSSFTAAEGSESSFVVADETEWWKPSNGGTDLAATLIDNVVKSGSRMLETSNAWIPGQDSVAEGTWSAWLAQEEGKPHGESKILYDARIAPPDTVLFDPVSLKDALEFVQGDCYWKDNRPVMDRIWTPTASISESKRKYLNWPTAAEDAWVTLEDWTKLADPSLVLAPNDEIVLFFDGSKSRDATALVACRMSDGAVFTFGVWEPDPAHDTDETIDATDVDRVVTLAHDYKVLAFFADVREWESFALSEWPNRWKDDYVMWAVPAGRPPQAVAWDMRSHKVEFAKAAEACHAEILEGGFAHDGNSATTRHVANARNRPYQSMISVGKESPASPRKIDAAVCVIGARMVRRLVLGSGKLKRRSGVVVGVR